MMNPELNTALEQLHNELDNTENMPAETRDKLRGLQVDITRAIDDPQHHVTLRSSLNEAGAQLEAEHPTLAAAISTVVNMLSRMGV